MPVGARYLAWGLVLVTLATAACNGLLGNSEHAVEVADGSATTTWDGSASGSPGSSGADSSAPGVDGGRHGSSSGGSFSSSSGGGYGSSSGSVGGSGSSSGSIGGGGSSSGGASSSSSGGSSGSSSGGGASQSTAGSGCTLADGTLGLSDLCGGCDHFEFTLQCPVSSCLGAPQRAPCTLSNGSFAECCGGVCADLYADNANCGACGQSCADSSACTDENCAQSCGTSAPCGAGLTCVGGAYCALSSCAGAPDGQACANPSEQSMCCGGACVSLLDPNNCGACGIKCASGNCGTATVFVPQAFSWVTTCVPEPQDGGTGCLVPGGCPDGETCIGSYCVISQCASGSSSTAYCAASDGNVGICVDTNGTPPFPCEDNPM